MSPVMWVKPLPGARRSSVGANMVPRKSTGRRDIGGSGRSSARQIARVAADLAHRACAFERESVLALDVQREVALAHVVEGEVVVEEPDERPDRAGGVVVLRLAEEQRQRPSKSRRLTSLPSVAPTIAAAAVDGSTTSGSGLFQPISDGCRPRRRCPTAAIGGALVKISASGPMPTSRYCDQTPCAISTSFRRCASSRARLELARSSPMSATDRLPDRRRPRRIAARLLLDDALEHRDHEGDAAALIACRSNGASSQGFPLSRVSESVFAISAESDPIFSPAALASRAGFRWTQAHSWWGTKRRCR